MRPSYDYAQQVADPLVRRIEVFKKKEQLVEIPLKNGDPSLIQKIIHEKIFLIKSDKIGINYPTAQYIAQTLLTDGITESARFEEEDIEKASQLSIQYDYVITTLFKPGVTDNLGRATEEALIESLIFAQENKMSVYTGDLYFIKLIASPSGEKKWPKAIERELKKMAEKFFANPLIQNSEVSSIRDFIQAKRFSQIKLPEVILNFRPSVREIPIIGTSLEKLVEIGKKNCWAFSNQELIHLKNYFTKKEVARDRGQKGLCQNPTDVEIEIIAQTWSEHCKHKIFNAEIDYEGKKIKSIFSTYIKGTTEKISHSFKNVNYLVSLFKDNAGIVCFHPEDHDHALEFSIKVETHNAPSALDPYGGALTGILGVNRDIIGVGLGSKPIANTNVFCVGDFFGENSCQDHLPPEIIPPKKILKGIHQGVMDGGNKSGIPTVNGAMVFHPDYGGRPLVFCGTIGAHPIKNKEGVLISQKYPKAGDLIFVGGGAIGKDGIHGATFSSLELDEHAPQNAVQIGDPITQKRVLDFTLKARDLNLFSSITDNGAGGLSSSIGEMALATGGATIDLALAPVKYSGLMPWELIVSEAQERMSYAVPKSKKKAFKQLAIRMGVDVREIGTFTSSGYLEIFYQKERCGHLSLEFLHDSLPPLKLKASDNFELYQKETIDHSIKEKAHFKYQEKWNDDIFFTLKKILGRPNIVSKEKLIRQYDHEVQGATHIKPFHGLTQSGPSNGAVLLTKAYSPEGPNRAIAVACGLAPHLSTLCYPKSSYHMAQHSLDEAVRNLVSLGGNPQKMAFVDNFCWPTPIASSTNPDGEHKLAQLIHCCQGLQDLALIYGTPLVSGKDSMKNDYIGKELKISIPPTLLMTGIADIEDARYTMTSGFKYAGDFIYLLGEMQTGLMGSEINSIFNIESNSTGEMPQVLAEKNKKLYQTVHKLIKGQILSSCHDISEGGVLVAISEATFANRLGANIKFPEKLKKLDPSFLFGEAPGRFIVSIPPLKKALFENEFKNSGIHFTKLGEVIPSYKLHFVKDKIEFSGEELFDCWRNFPL